MNIQENSKVQSTARITKEESTNIPNNKEAKMTKLEKKNIPPFVVAILNLFLASLGYFIIGQTKKGISVLILWFIGIIFFGFPALIITVMAIIDGLNVATAVENGNDVDEHEYKFEFLYKVAKLIHREAVISV